MKKKFFKTLLRYQSLINKELESFFNKEIKGARTPFLVQTLKIIKEFSLRPGKRIRAILIIYGYMMAGGKKKEAILKASIFIELIHSFLLVHDDIIDRGEIRRSKPTLHNIYQRQFKGNTEEKEHYGLSMALATGDLIDVLGRKILVQSRISPVHISKAIAKLEEVLASTIYGEMFELEIRKNLALGKKINDKDILDICKNKTALYTFVGPLQVGALLAGAGKKYLNTFESIGFSLGIAFQLNDDLQDMFSGENDIGSELGSDVKEGQPNFLIVKTINSKKGSIIKKYLGRRFMNKKGASVVKKAMIESGAYEECLQMAKKFITKAKKKISASQYRQEDKKFFLDLADYILEWKN